MTKRKEHPKKKDNQTSTSNITQNKKMISAPQNQSISSENILEQEFNHFLPKASASEPEPEPAPNFKQPNIYAFIAAENEKDGEQENIPSKHKDARASEQVREVNAPNYLSTIRDNKAKTKADTRFDKQQNTQRVDTQASNANMHKTVADKFYGACEKGAEKEAIALFKSNIHLKIKTWTKCGTSNVATIHHMARYGMVELLEEIHKQFPNQSYWKSYLAAKDALYQNPLIYALNAKKLKFAAKLVEFGGESVIRYGDITGAFPLESFKKIIDDKDELKLTKSVEEIIQYKSKQISTNNERKQKLVALCDRKNTAVDKVIRKIELEKEIEEIIKYESKQISTNNEDKQKLLDHYSIKNTTIDNPPLRDVICLGQKEILGPYHIVATNCDLTLLEVLYEKKNHITIGEPHSGKQNSIHHLNSFNKKQWTPLRCLLESGLKEFSKECRETLDYIMANGGDLNLLDKDHKTAFSFLLYNRKETTQELSTRQTMVLYLIENYGAKIETRTPPKGSDKTTSKLIQKCIEQDANWRAIFEVEIKISQFNTKKFIAHINDLEIEQTIKNSADKQEKRGDIKNCSLKIQFELKQNDNLITQLNFVKQKQESGETDNIFVACAESQDFNPIMHLLLKIFSLSFTMPIKDLKENINALLLQENGALSLFQQLASCCYINKIPFTIVINALRGSGKNGITTVQSFVKIIQDAKKLAEFYTALPDIKLVELIKMLQGTGSNTPEVLNSLLTPQIFSELSSDLERALSSDLERALSSDLERKPLKCFNLLKILKICSGSGKDCINTMNNLVTTIKYINQRLYDILKKHRIEDESNIIFAILVNSGNNASVRLQRLVDDFYTLDEHLQTTSDQNLSMFKSYNWVKIVKKLPERGVNRLHNLLYDDKGQKRTDDDFKATINIHLEKVVKPIKVVNNSRDSEDYTLGAYIPINNKNIRGNIDLNDNPCKEEPCHVNANISLGGLAHEFEN